MSEASKSARAAMKAKAERISAASNDKVDASSWTPGEPMNADAKTGMRPISRRAFKSGGKVSGEATPQRMDRKPRKSGGLAVEMMNRNQKEANEDRPGVKHVGGLKTGGRAKKADGGGFTDPRVAATDALGPASQRAGVPTGRMAFSNSAGAFGKQMGIKTGGRVKRADGGKTDNRDMTPSQRAEFQQGSEDAFDKGEGYRRGGKAKKYADGGSPKKWIAGAIKHPGALHKALGVPEGKDIPEKKLNKAEHSKSPIVAKRARLAKTLKGFHHKDGGLVSKDDPAGLRPKGGRVARKDGGSVSANDDLSTIRKKVGTAVHSCAYKDGGRLERKSGGRAKGKTNINIIIGAQKPAPGPMMPPGGPMPDMGAPPVPPPMGPSGAPPGAPAAPPMPPPQMQPPMGRKAGGRVANVHTGSGGGLGRLEKIETQRRSDR